jgi:hypothetical protein
MGVKRETVGCSLTRPESTIAILPPILEPLNVPKGIPFGTAHDKLTPVILTKIRMPLASVPNQKQS